MILDSANADTLAFAELYRARFGHQPVWQTTSAYDATRLAVATLRAVPANAGADVHSLRIAALDYLKSLNDPRAPCRADWAHCGSTRPAGGNKQSALAIQPGSVRIRPGANRPGHDARPRRGRLRSCL